MWNIDLTKIQALLWKTDHAKVWSHTRGGWKNEVKMVDTVDVLPI
jgi:hypothetical protein